MYIIFLLFFQKSNRGSLQIKKPENKRDSKSIVAEQVKQEAKQDHKRDSQKLKAEQVKRASNPRDSTGSKPRQGSQWYDQDDAEVAAVTQQKANEKTEHLQVPSHESKTMVTEL